MLGGELEAYAEGEGSALDGLVFFGAVLSPTADSLNRSKKRRAAPWKKVLYEKQPQYPSNFVPRSFLDGMVTNGSSREEVPSASVVGCYMVQSMAIAQQISGVAILLAVFQRVEQQELDAKSLLVVDLVLLVTGYAAARMSAPTWAGSAQRKKDESLGSHLISLCLFLAWLRIFAPVLRTLTESYATDSIQALTVTMCTMHLVCHNYSYVNGSTFRGGAVSLNAGMFAATLLASRLTLDDQVFSFTLLAVELFALLPMLRHRARRVSLVAHLTMTAALISVSAWLLHLVGPASVLAYVLLLLVVVLVCPLCLRHMQRYKFHIQGPWDIAHVSPAACRAMMEQQGD